MKRAKFVLIDGHALIHRAYHAIPPLTTKNGELVNAVYGFTSILLNVLRELKPECVAVAMDLPGKTFRHEEYIEYKATRKKTDDELVAQFGRVHEMVETLNIPIFEKEGYEADDVIGTLSTKLKSEFDVYIVTGDKDELQLIDEHVFVYTMRRGFTDTVIYDLALMQEKYGMTPTQFIDFKALKGDASDNIPGVAGVGDKTALSLIQEYGDLDSIYKNIELIKGTLKNKLETDKDKAYLSKRLATIVTDLDINADVEKCYTHDFDRAKVFELFGELGFKSLINKLPSAATVAAIQKPTEKPDFSNQSQGSLFELEATDKTEDSTSEMAVNSMPSRAHYTKDNYKKIVSESELIGLIDDIKQHEIIAVDTETTSLDDNFAELVGLSISVGGGKGYYIPVAHKNGQNIDVALILKYLKPILEDVKYKIVGHNLKFDYKILKNYGITIGNLYFDTMIAAFLVNPNARSLKLDELALSEFGIEMMPITSLIGAGKNQICFDEVDVDEASLYAAEDADLTYRLYESLEQEVTSGEYTNLLHDLEMPLVKVLANMELEGILVDIDKLEGLSQKFQAELNRIEAEIFKYSKDKFNIASPAQLQKVLYEELGLREKSDFPKDIKKLPSGGFSTGSDALEVLKSTKHPIVELVLKYRELSKLLNTYVNALPELVDKNHRIHTSFNQASVATGRISSTGPNLQNIPIRTELGAEIRKAFISKDGYSIVSADYSQIELRVVAHLSKDTEMLSAFRRGEDIHTATAARVYNVDPEKVDSRMRRNAKVVNFGIVYGVSAHGLQRQSDLNYEEAKEFIDKYFVTHQGIKKYMSKIVEDARVHGFAETLMGRKRYLSELNSSNYNIRVGAERVAGNMPIQGTAAEIMKLAMIKVAEKLPQVSSGSRLLLTVHDELVLEVPDAETKKVADFVKETMESVIKLDVPIVAEVGIGKNWGEAK
jgi:DNA polymerase-1